ncbi:hypothetical protein BD309DRAFT_963122 [Dichomitus squalens]|uniref:Uncharacterized protein n=1 Tax=Dichomitus squalens TaxID=114155 RepID=A0A4Q9Q5M7_9APHY|nr:hypothetical protein BD309DRAFT_963122 [Dichomitus squalens]TBU62707.1 hypothetical protein BD310DRAFT_918039 [Dichomitus squalens]
MTVAQNHPPLNSGVTRDVHDELVRLRAEKRRQAGGASPVRFHNDLLVGDDWTCMFLKRISQGVTMHQFDVPPATALDLGCGSGLWCIEAAKQWPDTKIVGFDVRTIQPDLGQISLGIEYRDLARRVQWVHGDFLEPLPFESNHFDLVRICCVGLWVPEDSWQELLEECSRVLAPGGILEIIEEDLLFPAGRTRRQDADSSSRLRASSTGGHLSGERLRSDSIASRLTTLTMQTSPTVHTLASSASSSSLLLTTERTSNSTSLDTLASSFSSRLRSLSGSGSGSGSALLAPDAAFRQDHARLRNAWEEMLDERFLSHKLLNVLQFYLSSAFSSVHAHPTMYVLLPPPSHARDDRERATAEHEHEPEHGWEGDDLTMWLDEMRAYMVKLNGDPEYRKTANGNASRAWPKSATVASYNTLHLSRQVGLIGACKEALWEAYRTLEVGGGDWGPGNDPPRDDLREEFERDWECWEEDMKDRMGVREQLQSSLEWRVPDPDRLSISTRPGSYLSGQLQTRSKKSCDGTAKSDGEPAHASICRALRGFVARKV